MKKEKNYLKPYKKRRFFKPKEKKLNRSMAGNTLLFVLMAICGVPWCFLWLWLSTTA